MIMLTRKRIFGWVIAVCFLGIVGWAANYVFAPAYEGDVGIAYGTAHAPERNQNIDYHIWYPANAGGRAVTVGGNGVFYGTKVGRGAPHRAGKFPLVLISHGAGGNAGQYGWIASELARSGFVVVIPNHPGSTSRNSSAAEAVKLWKRPADLSAVLDAIEVDPELNSYMDLESIAVLGFSAGGYTAMAIAGALVDPKKLENFCDAPDPNMSDCAFLARGGVNLHDMDLSPAGQSHLDERVDIAVVIDPGTVQTLTADSLRMIKTKMLIINLGSAGTTPHAVLADAAAALIPGATYTIVEDAIHFSFLAECKPKGRQILIDEGEADLLCEDGDGRSREKIHQELSQTINRYLLQNT